MSSKKKEKFKSKMQIQTHLIKTTDNTETKTNNEICMQIGTPTSQLFRSAGERAARPWAVFWAAAGQENSYLIKSFL